MTIVPPFRHTIPVGFADVDHAGIVYYPVFFHYFHSTFEAFFRARLDRRSYAKLMDEQRIGFPSVSAHCDYKAPLRFGDTMDIHMSIDRLGERSVTFRYQVYRQPDPDREGPDSASVLAAEGTNTSAVVDMDVFRAVPIPDNVRQLLAPLVGDRTARP